MNLAQRAYQELHPERNEHRKIIIKYSGRFSEYNANVKYNSSEMVFSLSRAWKEVSEEIQIGLLQELINKMNKTKIPSSNQDLYRSFMKHLNKYARIDSSDDYLMSRFEHINEIYFKGMMTKPNIRWGQYAYRKLGHYEYASDSIVISGVFKDAQNNSKVEELLDFVMYHEMLHKKHQYNHKKKGSHHHTKIFRADEALWYDKDIERKLKWFLRKKRIRGALGI